MLLVGLGSFFHTLGTWDYLKSCQEAKILKIYSLTWYELQSTISFLYTNHICSVSMNVSDSCWYSQQLVYIILPYACKSLQSRPRLFEPVRYMFWYSFNINHQKAQREARKHAGYKIVKNSYLPLWCTKMAPTIKFIHDNHGHVMLSSPRTRNCKEGMTLTSCSKSKIGAASLTRVEGN